MTDRLKKAIYWGVYIGIVLVAILTFIALIVVVFAPSVKPKLNIDGFKNYIGTLSAILSFLSVGMGVYSIWQASESNKQASQMINSLQTLKQQQQMLLETFKSMNTVEIVSPDRQGDSWPKDDVNK